MCTNKPHGLSYMWTFCHSTWCRSCGCGSSRLPRMDEQAGEILTKKAGEVPMKKIGTVFGMVFLLSLTAVGFAADPPLPAERAPRETTVRSERQVANSPVPSTAEKMPREATVGSECQGNLRMPGPYLGPDGVLHHVPKMQACNTKVY